ncbi:winged helix-turn-helix domain-containing protein [uncultured Reyranella sp.]|uniref:winged helix-turn-helix domain-containing protein n=1 Tax=uncultured Reyranella sp. TaxID=735512 RepID=UPI0025F9BD99|nr:winged helix-turn-helix domain-containing protein [uncultured Reyranella sp.]
MPTWKPDDLKAFAEAAQSLKLYRRAELSDSDTNRPLIEKLYVDPLPEDGVLQTVLRQSTTILIGRKGTGKSTVFQRAQHEIRKQKSSLSSYIDIKTVYESAEVDPALLQKISTANNALSENTIRRLLLYRAFIREVLTEIRTEIQKQIDSSLFERLKGTVGKSRAEVFEPLDDILQTAFADDFTDVTGISALSEKKGNLEKEAAETKIGASVEGSIGPIDASAKASARAEIADTASRESNQEQTYSRILLRNLNITGVMKQVADLLAPMGIRHLYIFIDDFSELPPDAMAVFVDTILAPLNNWSHELIKFKVAAYPNRVYYGQIDRTKIDEIYLDLFKLYGGNDVNTMEEKAIEFTSRLINNRLKYYCNSTLKKFAESDVDTVYRHLFYATVGNPRNLGHVLHNLRDSHLAYGKEIRVRAVRDAAAKYYEEKIEPYFGVQKFRHESFAERSSVFSLKELLEAFVTKARELRNHSSKVFALIEGRPPTSHFHVVSGLEGILSTLELNFFLTKYFEMKDRDGRQVSVYALNYGLCNRYSIEFGRPEGQREFRLYFVERIFDYGPIIADYLKRNQEIKCSTCDAVHGIDRLESLRLFDMLCPSCKKGTCSVTNLSKKYEQVLQNINDELLLPPTELGILEALYSEKRNLAAAEIAGELDCSYQLVGKRGKIMEERGLVNRMMEEKRRKFQITDEAVRTYFDANESRRLNLPDDNG